MNVLIRVLAGIGGHAQWEWGDGVQWGDGGGGRIGGQVAKVWAESWETARDCGVGGGGVAKGAVEDTLPSNPPLLSTPRLPLTDSDKGEEPALPDWLVTQLIPTQPRHSSARDAVMGRVGMN